MKIKSRLSSYFRARDRGWILSLLLAACLLYLPFLGSPFIFDDNGFFGAGAPSLYAHNWFQFRLRWLPYATLGWTEMLFSNVLTHFFHLGNLLLHAANSILVFYLLRALARAADTRPEKQNALIWGAWFGALVFALHPVAVYAVGYVVQRSILMATTFALLTQLAYLRALLSGKWGYLVLAAAAYLLAVFSKEHSVMTPALLLAETLLLRGQIRASGRSLVLAWAGFFLIAVMITLRAQGILGVPTEPMAAALFAKEGVRQGTPELHLLSALSQAGFYFHYLLLWLAPNPAWMSIDMREPFVTSLTAWQGWLGGAAFLAYGGIGLYLLLQKGRKGLLGLALLYPWVQFIVEFAGVRVQEPFVLYRSYLWMPGLMLIFPLLVTTWQVRLRARTMALAAGVLAIVLGAAAANRLWVMADNFRLWDDAARLLPSEQAAGADRIYFNRAQAEAGRGQLEAAIADFRRSLAISPQYAPVHFELGWVYFRLKRTEEAMAQFDEAIARNPAFAPAYFGKAMILKTQHHGEEAAKLMAKSCELGSDIACLIVKGRIAH